jgi:hypothetical protein
MVKPAVVFGSEVWTVAEVGMKYWVQGIYGPVVEQGSWSIMTYQEMGELYKDTDILADIQKDRLEWVGHVVRMD